MPHIEIFKSGVLTKRLDVSRPKAEAGCVIRLGSAGKVTLRLGEQTRLGEYDVRLVEDTDGSGGNGAAEAAAAGIAEDKAAKPARSEKCPRLEGYEIQHRLGEGGMGTVWQGIQLSTKRAVAIKFLSSRAFDSERAQRRFTREVELSAKLEHPNIARLYASGLLHGAYYYAMELVQGVPLDQYVKEAGLKPKQILGLIKTICEAVQHAHERGVIHRDLKPSNIMVGPDGRPHIVDFGLAKSLLVDETEKQLTVSIEGDVSGTPAYMSPEQAAGRLEEIDSRTDVYSLGVMLYRLLVGHPPHELSGTRYSVMKRIVEEEIRSPRELGVSINADLEGLLRKCLARSPADRYATAGDLARDIDNYLHGNPLVARKATFVYRMGKRMARHRAMAGVAACVAVLLVPLLAGLLPGGWIRRGMTETRTVEVVQTPVVKEVIVPATQPEAHGSLEVVVPLKSQADVAWDEVKSVDRGQGLDKQLDAAAAARLSAQSLFDQHVYDAAGDIYKQSLKLCNDIRDSDATRRKAADIRQAWQNSAETAKQAGAVNIAADLWGQSQALAGKADERFAAGDFVGAQLLWGQAAEAIGKVALMDRSEVMGDGKEHRVVTNSLGMKLVEIKPGTFLMGSPVDEPGRSPDEVQHHVTLTRGFLMGATLVTQAQWSLLMGTNPSEFQGDDLPVEQVSYDDATGFCAKLSEKEGKHYRLPTEAEWEYACRAGTTTAYYTGLDDAVSGEAGWYSSNSLSITHPVARKKPNAWGLYDMHGNVLQWCSDWYAEYPAGDATDPQGPSASNAAMIPSRRETRVQRGGVFNASPDRGRSAHRWSWRPEGRGHGCGFRVVLDLESSQSPVAASQPAVATQKESRRLITNSIGMKLVEIKPGTFLMGSPVDEPLRKSDEGQHRVTLTKAFFIGTTPVTQEQYGAVTGLFPSRYKGHDLPVECVTWAQAVDFCKRLSAREGRLYRLPTEAEWEYSCRAGTTTAYYTGNDEKSLAEIAWYGGLHSTGNSQVTTHPVGQLKPNDWGLYDQLGNVHEFCADWYAKYPAGDQTDPSGPATGTRQVLRGGSFWDDLTDKTFNHRAANRMSALPGERWITLGFRVVLEAEGIAPNQSTAAVDTPQILADLSRDWSDSENAHSGWSYRTGAVTLPAVANWTPLGAAYVQPAWAVSVAPGQFLPAWFSAADKPPINPAQLDWQRGDVIVHTRDASNGIANGIASVTWTSNFTGWVNIDGHVWNGAHRGRSNDYRLLLDGRVHSNGSLHSGDGHTRAAPLKFAAEDILVRTGEVIELQLISTTKYGEFVGVGLTIRKSGMIKNADDSAPKSAVAANQVSAENGATRTEITNAVGMKFVEIKPGTFLMGSPDDEMGRNGNEIQHKVTLTKSFYMGTTPVTQAQWKAVMGNNPSFFRGDGLPVEQVSYYDAVGFCKKLSEQEGKYYCLPTEAQWEYACRAGTTTAYYNGADESALTEAGWYAGNSGNRTHPVGLKKPNIWGLYDMHGNVKEWCSDWMGSYRGVETTNPSGAVNGSLRVQRGGAFGDPPPRCRSARRIGIMPVGRFPYVGFRVVLDPEDRAPSPVPTMTALSRFSGQVLRPDGRPAANAIVRICDCTMKQNGPGGASEAVPAVTRTDNAGHFSLAGIGAGDFTVRAECPGGEYQGQLHFAANIETRQPLLLQPVTTVGIRWALQTREGVKDLQGDGVTVGEAYFSPSHARFLLERGAEVRLTWGSDFMIVDNLTYYNTPACLKFFDPKDLAELQASPGTPFFWLFDGTNRHTGLHKEASAFDEIKLVNGGLPIDSGGFFAFLRGVPVRKGDVYTLSCVQKDCYAKIEITDVTIVPGGPK